MSDPDNRVTWCVVERRSEVDEEVYGPFRQRTTAEEIARGMCEAGADAYATPLRQWTTLDQWERRPI